MRCSYCYNPEIVFGKGKFSLDDALGFLKTRTGLLDAVVFSGGECLLHKSIVSFANSIRELGFLIKIDTNGSRPDVLQKLIESNLINYVALDFKALPANFKTITKSNLFAPFEKSLELLLANNIAYEVRTTIHSSLIDNDEVVNMAKWLGQMGHQGNYYLQHYRNGVETIAELPYSMRNAYTQHEAVENINVVIRG